MSDASCIPCSISISHGSTTSGIRGSHSIHVSVLPVDCEDTLNTLPTLSGTSRSVQAADIMPACLSLCSHSCAVFSTQSPALMTQHTRPDLKCLCRDLKLAVMSEHAPKFMVHVTRFKPVSCLFWVSPHERSVLIVTIVIMRSAGFAVKILQTLYQR